MPRPSRPSAAPARPSSPPASSGPVRASSGGSAAWASRLPGLVFVVGEDLSVELLLEAFDHLVLGQYRRGRGDLGGVRANLVREPQRRAGDRPDRPRDRLAVGHVLGLAPVQA